MGVGVHMKNIIREKGLTIKNVSEKSGVAVNTLYSITKRDSVRVDCIILSRIAGALGVRVQDLIGDDADLKRKGAETMTIDTAKVEILMAEQGLNQKELGERCGMPRQNISSIIRRGKAEPRTVGKRFGCYGGGDCSRERTAGDGRIENGYCRTDERYRSAGNFQRTNVL